MRGGQGSTLRDQQAEAAKLDAAIAARSKESHFGW